MNFINRAKTYEDISKFRSEISTLKAQLVGSVVRESIKPNLNIFKNYLNNLLSSWDSYARDITGTIRSIDVPETMNINTLSYNYMRRFIYSNFDYTSILDFLDDIKSSVINKDVVDNNNASQLFSSYVNNAFRLNVDSVGELLEIYLKIDDHNFVPFDTEARTMFQNVITSDDLFDRSERNELFTSVCKCLDNISSFDRNDYGNNFIEARSMITLITQSFEYIIFAVSVYMLKIFTIGVYIYPLVLASEDSSEPVDVIDSEDPEVIGEAVENYDDSKEKDKERFFQKLILFDHADILNPELANKFLDIFHDFCNHIGSISVDKDHHPAEKDIDDIKFLNKTELKKNDLYLLLKTYQITDPDKYEDYHILELHQRLKASIYPNRLAIPTTTSNKSEILHIIRSATYGNTISDISHLANDLYLFTKYFVNNINTNLRVLERAYRQDESLIDVQPKRGLNTRKWASEAHLMLFEFYHDFIFAVYRKLLYLNKQYIRLTEKNTDSIYNLVSLNVDLNHIMQAAAPDTMRLPDFYDEHFFLPAFEELELYDEFLRTCPEFANDMYLTEAPGDASSIVNIVSALLTSIYSMISTYFKNFGPAAKWVQTNGQALLKHEFTENDTIEVPIHKVTGKSYNITNMDTLLKGINPEVIKKATSMELEEFTKSLYPDAIYQWFADNADGKANIKFNNYFLFGVDPNNGEIATEPANAKISGNSIKPMLSEWIRDVSNADNISKKLNEYNSILTSTMNELKRLAANPPADTKAAPSPPTQTKEENQDQTADTTKKPENKTNPVTPYIDKVKNAMQNIWSPMARGVLKALREEYIFIQKAYTLSQGTTENSNKTNIA